MTETLELVARINSLLAMMNEKPLVTTLDDKPSELMFVREIRREYTARLLQQMPRYRSLPSEDLIPDALLVALRQRERALNAPE